MSILEDFLNILYFYLVLATTDFWICVKTRKFCEALIDCKSLTHDFDNVFFLSLIHGCFCHVLQLIMVCNKKKYAIWRSYIVLCSYSNKESVKLMNNKNLILILKLVYKWHVYVYNMLFSS